MVERKKWKEFKDSGMLWWINMILHTFGWAIVYSINSNTKEIEEVYPARVKFRGFDERSNSEGYEKVSKYLKDNSEELYKEAQE